MMDRHREERSDEAISKPSVGSRLLRLRLATTDKRIDHSMTTVKVGIAGHEDIKTRTVAVALDLPLVRSRKTG